MGANRWYARLVLHAADLVASKGTKDAGGGTSWHVCAIKGGEVCASHRVHIRTGCDAPAACRCALADPKEDTKEYGHHRPNARTNRCRGSGSAGCSLHRRFIWLLLWCQQRLIVRLIVVLQGPGVGSYGYPYVLRRELIDRTDLARGTSRPCGMSDRREFDRPTPSTLPPASVGGINNTKTGTLLGRRGRDWQGRFVCVMMMS